MDFRKIFLWIGFEFFSCLFWSPVNFAQQGRQILQADSVQTKCEAPSHSICTGKADSLSSKVFSIAAVGDLMLGAAAESTIVANGVDYPFQYTTNILSAADIAVANLEAPLTASGIRFLDKKYTFKVIPDFIQGIKNAGFDVLTLANNHIADWGCEGLSNTLAILDSNRLIHCGAGVNVHRACEPVLLEKSAVKIAFIGFSLTFPEEFWASDSVCGTCFATESRIHEVITKAKAQARLVVVCFHWGAEKSTIPKDYQKQFGHLAVDSGADLVIGHHPHVLQGLELYKNRLIAYSLGNFVFGSNSQTSRDSAILVATVGSAGIIQAVIHPISVYNDQVHFRPEIMTGSEKDRVISVLNELSLPLNRMRPIISADGIILP
jgi:poly-gamma-glutamate capsule biosynthesis protein CapA/YwtB (metallophosphatase superfamily)